MKRYLIPIVAVVVVLVVAWTAFGQAEERARQRESMRQRFQNMSEEEREKFRAQMRERGGFGRGGFMGREGQGQLEAIKAIEAQLAKLKAAQTTRPAGGFRDLPEDERAKIMEKFRKVRQDRQKALQTIIAQVARLQGRRGPAPEGEGAQYLIISTVDLKPIQDSAVKEKAKETAQLLERLIARGSGRRGFGGRPGTGRPQGGQRGTRGPRTPGGQRGSSTNRQENR